MPSSSDDPEPPRSATTGRRSIPAAKALKYWFWEIWREPWDHGRRVLLIKHFWSYLQFPPLPTRHLPDLSHEDHLEQARFSAAYARRVAQVQASRRRARGVHLTFRPIGKNLRLLGSAIRSNADSNQRTVIKAGGPSDEIRHLTSMGHQWSPWLWSRSADVATPAEPDAGADWSTLFRRPDQRPIESEPTPVPMPTLRVSATAFSRRHLERVLKVAAATAYVFDPVDPIRQQLAEQRRDMGWPPAGEPVLGIHVRRGDAAVSQGVEYTAQNSTRASFALERYLETADVICEKYGIRHIFLATESRDEIERARALRPEYVFLWLEHDRAIFPDIARTTKFIEEVALEHPERARPLAISAIQDLHFLGACQAFIGTFNSEFSLLAWLLAIGQQGHVIPYVSLSKALPQRSLHPFDALLNLRNNCPLELYHW